ncbi:hypothetical protein E2K60_14325, partial [Escherichia coli]
EKAMADYLCVSGCEIQGMGERRIYHLNNSSVVIEHPKYPGKTIRRASVASGVVHQLPDAT